MSTGQDGQATAIRQHTIGDLLRRTAGRVPENPAVACGEVAGPTPRSTASATASRTGCWPRACAPATAWPFSPAIRTASARCASLARIGAVLVPINFMLNADEVAFILRSSGAKVLAVGADFVELGRSAATRDTRIERIYWLPGEEPAAKPAGQRGFDNLLANDDAAPAIALDARMLAQIVYTSGTESLPKGAMLTRGSM